MMPIVMGIQRGDDAAGCNSCAPASEVRAVPKPRIRYRVVAYVRDRNQLVATKARMLRRRAKAHSTACMYDSAASLLACSDALLPALAGSSPSHNRPRSWMVTTSRPNQKKNPTSPSSLKHRRNELWAVWG